MAVRKDVDSPTLEALEHRLLLSTGPVAQGDAASILEDKPHVIVDVLANDNAEPGYAPGLMGFEAITDAGGTVTRNDNGTPDDPTDDTLTYTPAADFYGTDSFSYTADGILAQRPFADPVTYPAATRGSYDMDIVDLNGDGILDMATANFVGSIYLYHGNGDGTFTDAGQTTAILPTDMIAADFTGDGIVDFATVSVYTDRLLILEGDADGSYHLGAPMAAGYSPHALAAADFNQDGAMDVAMLNMDMGNLLVGMGHGDGTFDPLVSVAVGRELSDLCVADFNGDGAPDLVVSDRSDSAAGVYLMKYDGDGSFTQAGMWPSDKGAVSLATGDFNHDGNLDVAVANGASILLGDGNGGLSLTGSYNTVNGKILTSGDFNGDGNVDIASSNGDLLWGAGDGSFIERNASELQTRKPREFIAADLNADGWDDLVSLSWGDDIASVALSQPSIMYTHTPATATVTIEVDPINDAPSFTMGPDVSVGADTGPQSLIGWATDISAGPANEADQSLSFELSIDNEALFADGVAVSPDGTLTFEPTGVMGYATVTVTLRDDGWVDHNGVDSSVATTFTLAISALPTADFDRAYTREDQPVTIDVLDNDSPGVGLVGLADFDAVSADGGTISLDDNGTPGDPTDDQLIYTPGPDTNGFDRFTYSVRNTSPTAVASGWFEPTQTLMLDHLASAAAIGDLNGDGILDMVVYQSGSLQVLLGTGYDLRAAGELDIVGGAWEIAIGDINGDGHPDVIVRNYTAKAISVLLGEGGGLFAPAVWYDVDGNPASMRVADFDGDGRDDIALAVRHGHNVTIYAGSADGTLRDPQHYSLTSKPLSLAGGDFNGDGNTDLAVGSGSPAGIEVLLGNGDGAFTVGAFITTGKQPLDLIAGDFNHDGFDDLIVNAESETVLEAFLGDKDASLTASVVLPIASNWDAFTVGYFNNDNILDLAAVNQDAGSAVILLGDADDILTVNQSMDAGRRPVTILSGNVDADPFADLIVLGRLGKLTVLSGMPGHDSFGPSSETTVTVIVSDVNDPPTFTLAGDEIRPEGAVAYTVDAFAADIVAEPSDRRYQDVAFTVTTDKPDMFDVAPSIAPDGTLTYTVAAGAAGIATATVVAVDSGGVANGGNDTSEPQSFRIVIESQPDAADDIATTGQDQSIVLDVLGNDTVSADLLAALIDSPLTSREGGTIALDDGGTPGYGDDDRLIYTPPAGFTGLDSFNYTLGAMAPYNQAAGVLGRPLTTDVGTAVSEYGQFVTADFNGDAAPDLAMTHEDGTLSILLNTGDGTFSSHQLDLGFHYLPTIDAADLNGDGVVDLVASEYDTAEFHILLGRGDGTFDVAQTHILESAAELLLIADMNRDGSPDIVVVQADRTVIYFGQDNGDFTPGAASYYYGSLYSWSPSAVGDLNGDGWTDLAVFGFGGYDGEVVLLLGTDDGRLVVEEDWNILGQPAVLAIRDLNGDGLHDLLVGGAEVIVIEGRPYGEFEYVPLGVVLNGLPVEGDFNGDGILDLAVTRDDPGTVTVYSGTLDGGYTPGDTTTIGVGPVRTVAADFNGDGILDVATANLNSPTVSVIPGRPTFEMTHLTDSATVVINVAAPGDVDEDGDVDLNDFVQMKQSFLTGTRWEDGDLDGDGDVDLDDFVILKQNFAPSAAPAPPTVDLFSSIDAGLLSPIGRG